MKALSFRLFRTYSVLFVLILLATALRFYHIAEMPLRADEAMNLFFAADLNTIFRQVVTSDPHLPTFYILLHFWLPLAGTSELAERFPSLFASVLVVPLTFVLGRSVFPRQPRIALWGALLVAWNPYLIWDAQDAHVNAFLTVLSLCSFILFLRVIKPGATPVIWMGYIAVSVLDLYFHYFAVFVLVAEGALLLLLLALRRLPVRKMLHWMAAGIAIVALYTPWLVLAWSVLTGYNSDFLLRSDLYDMASRTLMAFTVGRGDSRLMPSMIEPSRGLLLALIFFSVFLVGLLKSGHQSKPNEIQGRLVPTTFFGVPLAIIFSFSIWRYPIFDDRYVLFLAPAFLLIVARGLDALYELPRARFVAFLGAGFIIAASAYPLYNYWYVPAYAKSPDWRGFVDRISVESQPGDVLIQNYPDPALPFYLKDRLPRVLLPRTSTSSADEVDTELTRLTMRYNRIWLQPAPHSTWDTEGRVSTWLARHARELRAYDTRGARLELYLTANAALRDAKPVGALLDNRIRLIAFDLDQGKPLALRLYWQTHTKLDRDYTVFVHLYASDGRLIAQKDTTPVGGTFPTTQWGEDETIVDAYEIAVPDDVPSGMYSLVAGMYDSQTHARLPTVDEQGRAIAENSVLLATVNLVSSNSVTGVAAHAQAQVPRE